MLEAGFGVGVDVGVGGTGVPVGTTRGTAVAVGETRLTVAVGRMGVAVIRTGVAVAIGIGVAVAGMERVVVAVASTPCMAAAWVTAAVAVRAGTLAVAGWVETGVVRSPQAPRKNNKLTRRATKIVSVRCLILVVIVVCRIFPQGIRNKPLSWVRSLLPLI